MSKTCFLLISVIERDILTETFDTKREAWMTIKQEMIQACDPEFRDSVDRSLSLVEEGDYVDMNDSFAIGEWSAYMDDDVARHTCDWRVVEIVIE